MRSRLSGEDPRPARLPVRRMAFWFAALAGACTHGARAAEPAPLTTSVRKEAAFSIADGEGKQYGLTRVLRNGAEMPAPANMRLEPQTGAFSWTPTESQAGDYEIHFLIRGPDGQSASLVRRVTVQPNDIVPPGDQSEVAKLLRQWYKEGTAAGNTGDFYDNRDRGHSMLNTRPYPQLDRVEYTKEQLDRRLDWALQLHFIYPHVTFGNSSTASGDLNLGSNPRHALLRPGAGAALHAQYTRNHLYIYPEHHDHDPGHNNRGGGSGDLFPANTPYFIISQGSSGSDQPFMRAIPYALAAFRPEVKELLVARGLLMPTVQMVFRMSNKLVEKPQDYLTGKAHPTVFDGGVVDPLKMVKLAHEIQRENVPPMAQIALLEEDVALNGVDYFEAPGVGERQMDTPAVLARIARSTRQTRRMVVSAKGSYDLNDRPLAFHWAVLRGDPDRIRINPVEKDGSVVELLIPWHERRPVLPGSVMESNRVDIGLFVHNGAYYSAPAFVCVFHLDDEMRTYGPDGRTIEVFYGYGTSTIGIPHIQPRARDKGYDITDWPALLAIACNDKGGLPSELLRKHFAPEELAELRKAAAELEAATAGEAEPQKKLAEAEAASRAARDAAAEARKKADAAKAALDKQPTDDAKKALAEAEAALKPLLDAQGKAHEQFLTAQRGHEEAMKKSTAILTAHRPALNGSVKDRLERALNALKDDPALYVANAPEMNALAQALPDGEAKRAFLSARDELLKLGILESQGPDKFALSPAVAGPRPPVERLTRFERHKLEWFHINTFQNVLYPQLINRRFLRNFVSMFLATRKSWRDLYHYDVQGRLTGWTRHEGPERKEFTSDGALVTKKDALGRPIEARTVAYIPEGDRHSRSLKQAPGDTIRHYTYADDKDRVGRLARTEKAPQ